MSNIVKPVLLTLALLLFAGTVAAQSGWVPNKTKLSVDLVAVYFTSADRGWVAGDDGYLASTSNGGRTWEKYPLGTTEGINEIYFRNESNGYLVAGKKMFLTKDAGETWTETQNFQDRRFSESGARIPQHPFFR